MVGLVHPGLLSAHPDLAHAQGKCCVDQSHKASKPRPGGLASNFGYHVNTADSVRSHAASIQAYRVTEARFGIVRELVDEKLVLRNVAAFVVSGCIPARPFADLEV